MALVFFLGGRDLEMVEIGRLVRAELGEEAVADKALSWSEARASVYGPEIRAALAHGRKPVLVELKTDLPHAVIGQCHIVDHHGERAGATAPTAIEQVFALLGLSAERWTRRLALVAANDRGWIPEMRAIGATTEEIEAIRMEDRAAQGVTAEQEASAPRAIAKAERRGDLLVVRLDHSRAGAVLDRLALDAGNEVPSDTLVIGADELNFSGHGGRVLALVAAFPDGWYGGALPGRGYWGHAAPLPPLVDVLAILDQN